MLICKGSNPSPAKGDAVAADHPAEAGGTGQCGCSGAVVNPAGGGQTADLKAGLGDVALQGGRQGVVAAVSACQRQTTDVDGLVDTGVGIGERDRRSAGNAHVLRANHAVEAERAAKCCSSGSVIGFAGNLHSSQGQNRRGDIGAQARGLRQVVVGRITTRDGVTGNGHSLGGTDSAIAKGRGDAEATQGEVVAALNTTQGCST